MAATLAACTGAPVQSSRVVPGDPAAVGRRVEAEMRALGLRSTRRDDGIVAARTPAASDDWAGCSPALVGRGGANGSRRLVSVRNRKAEVEVTLVPDGAGTRVEVNARFTAGYDNPETASHFERPCRSTGVLEAQLLAAAAGA